MAYKPNIHKETVQMMEFKDGAERRHANEVDAVDPLSLVLRGDIYVKIHLPDPPPDEVIQERVRESVIKMSPEQKQKAYARAKALSVYVRAMEKELGK